MHIQCNEAVHHSLPSPNCILNTSELRVPGARRNVAVGMGLV
jgi:hypothetical protein